MTTGKTIIHYLEGYLNLPGCFFRPESNLYILSVISYYFASRDKTKYDLKFTDIDPLKLSWPVAKLDKEISGKEWKIYLHQLLKKSYSKKIYYTDVIGTDGFSEHYLNIIWGMMELNEKFKDRAVDLMLIDKVQTVEELMMTFNFRKKHTLN